MCIISSTHCASNILYSFLVTYRGERWKNEVKKFNQEYAVKINKLLEYYNRLVFLHLNTWCSHWLAFGSSVIWKICIFSTLEWYWSAVWSTHVDGTHYRKWGSQASGSNIHSKLMLTEQHDMQNGPCHLFISFLFFKCHILFLLREWARAYSWIGISSIHMWCNPAVVWWCKSDILWNIFKRHHLTSNLAAL